MPYHPGIERREFFRYQLEKPLTFQLITHDDAKNSLSRLINADSKNVSATGILFSSKEMPRLSSIIVLDLDPRVTKICQEIEENALVVKNKLLGKVVRIEDNEDGLFNIGVAFIKKNEAVDDEIVKLIP